MKYEIRAMSFGEILDTAFQLLKDHFVPLVGLQLVVVIPSAVISLYVGDIQNDPELAAQMFTSTAGLVSIISTVAFFLLISPLIGYAITTLLGSYYQSQPTSPGDALKSGAAVYLPIVGTGLLAGIFIILGTLLFVLPGIYLILALSFVTPIIVFESLFGMKNLSRSRELASGNLLRIFGLFLIVAIINMALSFGASMFAIGFPVVSTIAQSAVTAITAPFAVAAQVVLYFDIRCRKENFDLEHLSNVVASSSPDPIG